MKNLGITRGNFVDGRRFPIPTIEYEHMYYGVHYLCLVWWKWFFGLNWEDNER